MARQLCIDVYNNYFLAALQQSQDKTLAAIADKAAKESRYHLRRSTDWVLRLGDGTDESHQRMQNGLEESMGLHPTNCLNPMLWNNALLPPVSPPMPAVSKSSGTAI